jgi:hypothetical protein
VIDAHILLLQAQELKEKGNYLFQSRDCTGSVDELHLVLGSWA